MNWLFRIPRFLLAAIFLYAGLVKASASTQFAVALAPFTFLPGSWIGPLALILPITETLGGILLLLPWTKKIGAGLVLALCLGFMAALGWALANGIIVACSCFGREETASAFKMALALGRDAVLAAGAGLLLAENGLRKLRNAHAAKAQSGHRPKNSRE